MCVLDWVGLFCSHWIQLLHTCLREVTIISQECCFCSCPSHGMFINRNGPEECGQRTKCDSAASFLWTLPCVSLLAGRAESWVCICEWTTFLFVPTGIFMCLTTSSVSNILQYSMQVCRDPQVSLISCTLSQSGLGCVHLSTTAYLCTLNNFCEKKGLKLVTEYALWTFYPYSQTWTIHVLMA